MTGKQDNNNEPALFSRGVIAVTLTAWSTYPVDEDRLITLKMEVLIKAKTSLKSLVGIGSKRHVDGLEEASVTASSESSTGQKQSRNESSTSISPKTILLDGIQEA